MPPLKRVVEYVLAHGGPAAVARRRRGGSTVILAYHDIVADRDVGGGDRSLHLGLGAFARQLDALLATHDVVGLDALVDDDRREEAGRPWAAITFDDAYRGAVTLGLEALRERDLPATFFVSPLRLGGQAFWWDRLASGNEGQVADGLRERALGSWRGRQELVLERTPPSERSDDGSGAPWTGYVSATVEELARAARAPGITVGSHGWSHANLAALSADELRDELARSLAWIRERFPERGRPWIAYPYGRRSPEVVRLARDAGYRAGFLVEGGWHRGGGPMGLEVPRLNVPAGVSPEGFVLRAAGLLT